MEVPPWERWGPYVSERAWGTVREDYSENGDAWNFFPHDHARKKAFRWGEDAIAGLCDRYQVLVFAPVFWNGQDPILKERLFGLNPYEGNHGEDVKELYYHLDATPTASYLKYLYKYPQQAYPYTQLIEENQRRGTDEPEYELLDTGLLNENRYFDLYIEYAKASPDDICIRIEAINRGPEAAPLHVLPHLWFRNQWSWGEKLLAEPSIQRDGNGLVADDRKMPSPYHLLAPYHLGKRYLYSSPHGKALFTNNETNQEALFERPSRTPYVKDAFHRYLIEKDGDSVNPAQTGTKAAIHYFFPEIKPGKSKVLYLRLTSTPMKGPLENIDEVMAEKKKEADLFYQKIHPVKASEEEKRIQRQALSGMVWNQQMYFYAVNIWLNGDNPSAPPPEERKWLRNTHWRHLVSMRILSMPDKWEYPWFAAWDLTFHSLSLALIDIEFAKQQLWFLLFDQFQHPNGAIPAYEWNFSEINPPVQAWAALKIFTMEKKKNGTGDLAFLEKCFHKLLLNFAWWVNKVDSLGHNVFEGGFLGLDNIGFLDRSEKLPEGFLMDQADGAGWISLLCLNMMRIALILAKKDPVYEGLGIKFFQHFVHVAAGVRKGQWRNYDMWDDEDGFFHSFLRHPDGEVEKIPIRSAVGIIPFFALDVWDLEEFKQFPNFYLSYQWMLEKNSELTQKCVHPVVHKGKTHYVLGFLNPQELSKFLTTLWDPEEFRSPYGLRSLSKYHEKHPAQMHGMKLAYEPGEATEKIKGGNSNWRGPVWFPINYLLIETLLTASRGFEDRLQIHAGQEKPVSVEQMARYYSESLLALFKKDKKGRRPLFGDNEKLQKDPEFSDYLLFYEHFHGDTGRGLGASHQTGWTGLVANLIDELRT
jgi:hypothetical protein